LIKISTGRIQDGGLGHSCRPRELCESGTLLRRWRHTWLWHLEPQLVEGFSMPWFTNRTACAAHQAPSHRPLQSLLCRPWGLCSSGSCFSAPPGLCSTGRNDLPRPPNPQACQAQDPQTCTTQVCQAHAPQTHWISAGPVPLRPTRPTLHRPARFPQWQASAHRPLVPCLPATRHRRAPKLPRRHRQIGLDAKGVTPELLRLKFYCSWTIDFFFAFL
jgi:hypothetical protein